MSCEWVWVGQEAAVRRNSTKMVGVWPILRVFETESDDPRRALLFYNTQRASIATLYCPGLLATAPSQIPQSARREDHGEAPQSAERPECPDEEKAAGGFGDLAVMCPSHVHDGHGCC